MFPFFLLPDSSNFRVERVEADEAKATIKVEIVSIQAGCACPLCGQISKSIHSKYWRKLADLPSAGSSVSLRVQVRKFFCKTETCARRIFTERFAKVTEPYARRTKRLTQTIAHLGLAVGGAMGERISRLIGFPSSVDVLLANVRKLSVVPVSKVRVVGIDDWAIKKGRRYGTVLVDMETSRPIELLPSRETRYVAEWLKRHPEIEVVSRDRAGGYAEAARVGSPNAVQVADRWHILKNLSDALRLSYERHRSLIKQIRVDPDTQLNLSTLPPEEAALLNRIVSLPAPPEPETSPIEQMRAERRAYWEAKFAEVHELRKQGLSIGAIVRQTKLYPRTVKKISPPDCLP